MSSVKTPRRLGASLNPKYVHRDVDVYGMSKMEIDNLSSLQMQSSLYFSISSALVGYALAIFTNAAFYSGALTPMGELATKFVAPFLIFLSVVFVSLGFFFKSKRDGVVKELLEQGGEASGLS